MMGFRVGAWLHDAPDTGYNVSGKNIKIGSMCRHFEYDIRTVLQDKEKYIVLLAIPFDSKEINNIYCLNSCADLVWQAEDLSVRYPSMLNLPYEYMRIKDGAIFATDFYGRSYKININSGKIEGYNLVK